jgi:hypothetical protein
MRWGIVIVLRRGRRDVAEEAVVECPAIWLAVRGAGIALECGDDSADKSARAVELCARVRDEEEAGAMSG